MPPSTVPAPDALRIEGLTVAYGGGEPPALRDVDLVVPRGVAYGLVGESGSGKSTLALASLRYLGGGGRVLRGRIELDGLDLLDLPPRELRRAWRDRVRLVPQDPLASLNPSLTIGRQVAEGLADGVAGRHAERVVALLVSVGLADPARIAASYPHQLSGGMQQRVAIAMALGGAPGLLVMDEPTTNLDATTEATILDLVRALRRSHATAVLYVSHSLAVVAQLCDRVAVLYAGEVVEDAPVADLYARPWHPYTRGLLDALPRVGQDRRTAPVRPIAGRAPTQTTPAAGCAFADRCPVAVERCRDERPPLEDAGEGRRVRCFRWHEIAAGTLDPRQRVTPPRDAPVPAADAAGPAALRVQEVAKGFALPRSPLAMLRGEAAPRVRAVEEASIAVASGRTLGLVGESGSGKSTLARIVVGLTPPDAGRVVLLGAPLAPRLERRDRARLGSLQMVFQNSGDALNPYLTVAETLARPLRRLAGASPEEIGDRVRALLASVQLPPEYAQRTPAQLSGGEQQRVAIARAFATEPDVVVLDESVSGLDVSVQAAILDLLTRLQDERRSAYLFISHDLAVVAYLADDVAVMYLGRVMEVGPTAAVLRPPYHPYTEALLSAVLVPDPTSAAVGMRLCGDVPSPVDRPTGCPFHPRCPRSLGDVCAREAPPWRHHADGTAIACHVPLDELERLQPPIFVAVPDDRAAASGAAPATEPGARS